MRSWTRSHALTVAGLKMEGQGDKEGSWPKQLKEAGSHCWQTAREQEPQLYSHKELKFACNLKKPETDSPRACRKEPLPRIPW